MQIHRKTVLGSAASVTTVSLEFTADDNLKQSLCDFNVEVSGNDAVVTVTGKGSFPASVHRPFAGGSFAIGGDHVSGEKYALSELAFTTTGSAYTIMITRQLGEK